jgi:hypothetical protein
VPRARYEFGKAGFIAHLMAEDKRPGRFWFLGLGR